ncbi:MAG: MmcB family DNA repair protein [Alphaproteobacteria bacterium]
MSGQERFVEQMGNGHAASRTSEVVRGVMRLLLAEGFSPVNEFTLGNGRRLDVAGLDAAGDFIGVEVKTSVADFRADEKWPEYLGYCDYFYFAVPPEFPRAHLPNHTGLMVADRYGGAIVAPAPRSGVHPSRRRAIMLAFARMAAERLARVHDSGDH